MKITYDINWNIKPKGKNKDKIQFNEKFKDQVKHNYWEKWGTAQWTNLSKTLKKHMVKINKISKKK